jgi:hypothetical protein
MTSVPKNFANPFKNTIIIPPDNRSVHTAIPSNDKDPWSRKPRIIARRTKNVSDVSFRTVIGGTHCQNTRNITAARIMAMATQAQRRGGSQQI